MKKGLYLSLQSGFTPIATDLLTKAVHHFGFAFVDDKFIPGIAVVLSHVFILLLTYLHIPSLEERRVSQAIDKKRKKLKEMIASCTSDAQKSKYQEMLNELDVKELESLDIGIAESLSDLSEQKSTSE